MHTKNAKNFLENVCLSTNLDLRLKTKQKIWGNFKITRKKFCVAIKNNASHTIFIYGNCLMSAFSKRKQKLLFFHHQIILLESNSSRK